MTTIRRVIAAMSIAIALTAFTGTALAGTFDVTTNGTYVEQPPTAVDVEQYKDAIATPSVVRVTSASSGFNWGDAVIGAVAGIAITALILGSGLAVAQHRPSNIRHA